MGTANGMYRLTDELYDELTKLREALRRRCDLATRLLKRAAKTCMRHVRKTSILRTVLADVKAPVREYLDITHALEVLRYGGLAVFQEFDVCWTAFQRAYGVMAAYFDFVCAIIPSSIAPELRGLARLIPGAFRRGIVLSGSDIKTYIGFFRRLDIPVWVYIALASVEAIPRDMIGPADDPRCDVSVCEHLSTSLVSSSDVCTN